MRKAKDAARRNKFGDLIGDEREAAIAQAQQNATARVELFKRTHRASPDSLAKAEPGATGLAMASSSASSSLVRKPRGFTTGITF